jgi:hypothetical protein
MSLGSSHFDAEGSGGAGARVWHANPSDFLSSMAKVGSEMAE